MQRFGPRFRRLAEVLNRDPAGLELTGDPSALAPERLLVFEVRGSIQNFASAIRKVDGLELIDEEELVADDQDKSPVAYLLVPDATALGQVLSLWQRWSKGQDLDTGYTPWRDVFACLRDLRPWGPADRVRDDERDILAEQIDGMPDDALIRLELELVFRKDDRLAVQADAAVGGAIAAVGGRRISRARLEEIAYHAMLVDLPAAAVRAVIQRLPEGLAGQDEIRNIRPQSIASSIDVADPAPVEASPPPPSDRPPILALLDGVPIAAHPLLDGRLTVEDRFDLEPTTVVEGRVHGTAMASLIVHGDRNRPEAPLPRRIHMVPVMTWDGLAEVLPDDRLVVDVIYQAVVGMRDGSDPTAPTVIVVNLSLGNPRRPFHGQMSAWARLLDRLAWRYGLLFVVSAGNAVDRFPIPAYPNGPAFEDANPHVRAVDTLRAIHERMSERRIISPAETVNGITVGGANEDWVSAADRRAAAMAIDPYPDQRMANPSSRLGPGFANSIKPDLLMPGAREHLRPRGNSGSGVDVEPTKPGRAFGLKVAAPQAREAYTNGTSAAAALASRACHRIHDALEDAYGDQFSGLVPRDRAVLLKALLAHPARWPDETAQFIRETIGPDGRYLSVQRKDNIRRYLGYGVVDADQAVQCAADRATFWATGSLESEQSVVVEVPIPVCLSGQSRPHALWATLAWFTPVQAGRRSYRSVRLKILDPEREEVAALRVKAAPAQPDVNQSRRGTVSSRRWEGGRAPVVIDGTVVRLLVQREPDQGEDIDEAVPFGLAVTLSMPGVVEIYDQVRQRLAVPQRAGVRQT